FYIRFFLPLRTPPGSTLFPYTTLFRSLWEGIAQDTPFYFVHSYYAEPADPALTAGTSLHGLPFCCAIADGNIFAVQFHPEKSAAPGLRMYRNFTRWQP